MSRLKNSWLRRGLYRLAVCLTVLLMLTVSSQASVTHAADSGPAYNSIVWTKDRVNPQALIARMGPRSLRLDSNGKPRIAFGGDHLYYGYSDNNANWIVETVDPSLGVGLFASLALDSANNPYISYYDVNKGVLKYAYNIGAGWKIQVIDTPTQATDFTMNENASIDTSDLPDRLSEQSDWRSMFQVTEQPADALPVYSGRGLYSTITLDINGKPHISYYDAVNGDLKYAYSILGSWQIRTIDSAGDVGAYSSMTLDASAPANAFFSYYDATNKDLKYAIWYGSTLKSNYNSIDTKDDVGQFTSIAMSPSGVMHISYYDVTNSALKYAKASGGIWQTTTIVTGGDEGTYTSIALDSTGKPRIGFQDATNGDMKIASFDGQSWGAVLVSNAGFTGFYGSLAIDKNNNTFMSFYDGGNGLLKYAVQSGANNWLIYNVTDSRDTGLLPALALDSNGNPHISYLDDTHDTLMYAHWNGTVWNVSKVDASNEAGLYNDIALDSNNNPSIAYYDGSHGCLNYAYWSTDHWIIQALDCKPGSDRPRGMYVSLTIDSQNYVYISYYDAQNGSLKLATTKDGGWGIYTVDNGENSGNDDVGLHTSIAVQIVSNVPHIHISYYDATNKGLRYAKWTGGPNWQIIMVDGVEAGMYSSIALDTNDYAHFAYLDDYSEDTLKYAWYDVAGLHIEKVDPTNTLVGTGLNTQKPISLAVDSTGVAHISYFDYSHQNLMYARRTDRWRLYILDGEGDVGRYSSIAAKGNAAGVAYYDATNGDLIYASSKVVTNAYTAFLPLVGK